MHALHLILQTWHNDQFAIKSNNVVLYRLPIATNLRAKYIFYIGINIVSIPLWSTWLEKPEKIDSNDFQIELIYSSNWINTFTFEHNKNWWLWIFCYLPLFQLCFSFHRWHWRSRKRMEVAISWVEYQIHSRLETPVWLLS